MHTLLEGSNLLRSPYNHFYGWLLFVITSRQIKLESCGWSQIVDFEEIYSMVYDRLWFWPFLPELCPNKGIKGCKSPFWYNNLNYITQKYIFLKRRPKEYLDMIQNSFVYLRRAQNQRKTQSFSISISAVALMPCDLQATYNNVLMRVYRSNQSRMTHPTEVMTNPWKKMLL